MTTLNFYHTFLTFNDLEKETFLKALSEKEKMLVTSISAFPYNVIYPIRDNKTLLYSHLISSLKMLSVWTMSKTLSFDKDLTLPNDKKILDYTKLKANSDYKINVTKILKLYLENRRKHFGKKRKCW